MTTIDVTEIATLWLDDTALPVRMLWRGRRWKVTDHPTEPEGLYWSTHAPDFIAWRFQATDENGVSHVFDVVRPSGHRQHRDLGRQGGRGDDHWTVAHIYD